jgi:hypothetical protein
MLEALRNEYASVVVGNVAFVAAVAIVAVGVAARRFKRPLYPMQKFSRSRQYFKKAEVLPLRVPWTVRYSDYAPVETERTDQPLPWWFRASRADGRRRFLCETSAFLFARVPYNPYGRTGASGRGVLKHWGPNRITVVVFMNRDNHMGRVSVAYDVVPVSGARLLHAGYVDHPANTDNAWLEGCVYVDLSRLEGGDVREEYPWLVPMITYSTPPPSPARSSSSPTS